MPEGPEVLVLAQALNRILKGTRIVGISWHGIPRIGANLLSHNLYVQYVKAKGKLMYMELLPISPAGKSVNDSKTQNATRKNQTPIYICSHLGMTGIWQYKPNNYNRVDLSYKDTNQVKHIYFNDVRKLGKFLIVTPARMKILLDELGPDVLSPKFTEKVFEEAVNMHSKRKIAEILSDQSIISGIGNYLRCEILYKAGINPFKSADDLTPEQWKKLYKAIIAVCYKSYDEGGSATLEAVSSDPDTNIIPAGKYKMLVYGRKTDNDGHKVINTKLAGRTVHWVAQVQK